MSVSDGPLKRSEVAGPAEKGSQHEKEALAEYDKAQQLLGERNAEELFTLYEKAVRQRNETMKTMLTVAEHYMGSKNQPLYEPPSSVIKAMETVSLAAISLARDIAVNNKT